MAKDKFKELHDLLDKDISKSTGISISELTLDKIEELLKVHDYPVKEPLIPANKRHLKFCTMAEQRKIREKVDKFLKKYSN